MAATPRTTDPASAPGPMLADQAALVTGARGGIGAAIASRLAEAGAGVVIHYRSGRVEAEALVERLRRAGHRAESVHGDLSDHSGALGVVNASVEALGQLDILVNNAAVQAYYSSLEVDPSQWDLTMASNLRAPMFLSQAMAAHLIERECPGSVVHVSSIVGVDPRPATVDYSVSKAGLVALAKAQAIDYGPHGIRVNAVVPGLIDSPSLRRDWPEGIAHWNELSPLARVGSAMDVAEACLYLVSPAASWISGTSLTIDGGMSARAPW